MDSYGDYQVIESTPGRRVRTFKARHKSTGDQVFLHWMDKTDPAAAAVNSLPANKRARVIHQRVEAGRLLVVTDCSVALPFEDWVGEASGTPAAGSVTATDVFEQPAIHDASTGPAADLEFNPPDPKAKKDPVPKAPDGEFTRLFKRPQGAVPPARSSQGPSAGPPARAEDLPSSGRAGNPAERAPAPSQVGEFTRLFRPDESGATEPLPSAKQVDPDPTFAVTEAPPPATTTPPPGPDVSPGDFTRLFNPSGAGPASSPEPASPLGNFAGMLDRSPGSTSSDEFTRVFGRSPIGNPETPAPPPPDALHAEGDFTRLFEKPRETRPPGDAPSRAAEPVVASPGSPAPPGARPLQFPQLPLPGSQAAQSPAQQVQLPQYQTPELQMPQSPTAQLPPASLPPAADVPRAPNYLPLVIILSVLLAVAIAMVVYFAMR